MQGHILQILQDAKSCLPYEELDVLPPMVYQAVVVCVSASDYLDYLDIVTEYAIIALCHRLPSLQAAGQLWVLYHSSMS